MKLTNNELNTIRQWYNAINDINPTYLGEKDAILYVKIMENLELRPNMCGVKDYFWLQCDKGKIGVSQEYKGELLRIALYSLMESKEGFYQDISGDFPLDRIVNLLKQTPYLFKVIIPTADKESVKCQD